MTGHRTVRTDRVTSRVSSSPVSPALRGFLQCGTYSAEIKQVSAREGCGSSYIPEPKVQIWLHDTQIHCVQIPHRRGSYYVMTELLLSFQWVIYIFSYSATSTMIISWVNKLLNPLCQSTYVIGNESLSFTNDVMKAPGSDSALPSCPLPRLQASLIYQGPTTTLTRGSWKSLR